MKKVYSLLALMLLLNLSSVIFIGCESNTNVSPSANTSTIDISSTDEIHLTNYSIDEIYGNGIFSDSLASPAYKRTRIFPTNDVVFSFYTVWNRLYTSSEDHTLSYYPLCQDPICTHENLPCISYAAITSSEIIEANGLLYMLIDGEGEKYNKFIEYDLSTGQYTILSEFENGGQLITRLGRFIYFYIIRVDDETESGQQLTTRLLHRYDILDNTFTIIDEISSKNGRFFLPSTKYGYIYYIDSYDKLLRCDMNMKNKKELASNVVSYEVTENRIYYLSKQPEKEYGTIFEVDLDTSTTTKLYDEITWFCLYQDIMYYSIYSPISAFEWDFPMQDENAGYIINSTMISIDNGNVIYKIDLDRTGSPGEQLNFCTSLTNSHLYLGNTFSVFNGFVFTQLKESYHHESKKGMHTGIAAIDIATGNIYWIDSEYVLYS